MEDGRKTGSRKFGLQIQTCGGRLGGICPGLVVELSGLRWKECGGKLLGDES